MKFRFDYSYTDESVAVFGDEVMLGMYYPRTTEWLPWPVYKALTVVEQDEMILQIKKNYLYGRTEFDPAKFNEARYVSTES